MESATVLSISIGVMVVLTTAYGLYLSFGSASKQLADPFDDHED
jgi:PsbN protein